MSTQVCPEETNVSMKFTTPQYITYLHAFVLGITVFLCSSCSEEVTPDSDFFTIYDDQDFDALFVPKALHEFDNGNFLLLSGQKVESSDFEQVHIMLTTSEGRFILEETLESNYVHALPELLAFGDSAVQFFSMDTDANNASVLHTIQSDGSRQIPILFRDRFYPLSSTKTETGVALLSFDHINERNIISLFSHNGTVQDEVNYRVTFNNDLLVSQIFNHFNATSDKIPFELKAISSDQFIVNAIFDEILRMQIININSGLVTGSIKGFGLSNGVVAAGESSSTQYAVATFDQFGVKYHASQSLQTNQEILSTDLTGNLLPEIDPEKDIKIKAIELRGNNYSAYGASTKSGQVSIKLYDNSGALAKTIATGQGYEYSFADFVRTSDGGLAILSEVLIAGRFPRPALQKISQENLEKNL